MEDWKVESAPEARLVAGEDYYAEGAAIVFTAGYLWRRGYCCESGCRHCPYRGPGAIDQPVELPPIRRVKKA